MKDVMIQADHSIRDTVAPSVIAGGFHTHLLQANTFPILQEAKTYCLGHNISQFNYPYLTGVSNVTSLATPEGSLPDTLISCHYDTLSARADLMPGILKTLDQQQALYVVDFTHQEDDALGLSALESALHQKVQVDDIGNIPTLAHELTHGLMNHLFGHVEPYKTEGDEKRFEATFSQTLCHIYAAVTNSTVPVEDKATTYVKETCARQPYVHSDMAMAETIKALKNSPYSLYENPSKDLILQSIRSIVEDYKPHQHHAELIARYVQLSVDQRVDQAFLSTIMKEVAAYYDEVIDPLLVK
jgi:hypothetical protein